MGNYCSSQSDHCHEYKLKHKITKKIASRSKDLQRQETRNSQNQLSPQKNDQATIVAHGIETLCSGLPLIRGGQSEIFEIDGPLIQQCLPKSPNQDIHIVIKKILKTQSIDCTVPSSPSRQLFMENESPFLIKGLNWLNGDKFIFQLMEKQEGGDLTTFLESTRGKGDEFRKLGQEGIKIILAGIILGLEYIHNHNIVYCDMKLENVLIGKDGYPIIIDFDLSQVGPRILAKQAKGTIIYAAPQIFTRQYIDKSVDFWALGILTYMLFYGEPPFEEQEVLDPNFEKMCKRKQNNFYLKRKRASPEIIDLINSLLRAEPSARIGSRSIQELKKHAFFKDLDWSSYQQKQLENPLQRIVDKYSPKNEHTSFQDFSQKMDYLFVTPRKNSADRYNKTRRLAKASF